MTTAADNTFSFLLRSATALVLAPPGQLPPVSVRLRGVVRADATHARVALSSASDPTTGLAVDFDLTPDGRPLDVEAAVDHATQARKLAERPELRIISRGGEELAADALGISGFERWGCNDYVLIDVEPGPTKPGAGAAGAERYYIVLSPRDIVVVRPRDWRDHVGWLVERQRYEEALEVIEHMGNESDAGKSADADGTDELDAVAIGQRYIEHLVSEGDFAKAARLCPKVCAQDAKRWEDWIFIFAQKHELQAIIPFVPTESPTLSHMVYGMILAHFLSHDRQVRSVYCLRGGCMLTWNFRRSYKRSRHGRRASMTSPRSSC